MRLFLGTNSHFEYMNLIMTTTLGEGWEQLFDLHISNCQKPNFFTNEEAAMYKVDTNVPSLKGAQISDASELQLNTAYLEGNARLVT